MAHRTNPSTPSRLWLRIIVRSFLALVILLAITGFVYENISEARDRRFHPMPGQLIDIGGYKLHINCQGQGTPVVILDSGLGDSYVSWRRVQPQIAQFARVCSYDRGGLGYSDPSPRPRTSKDLVEELHTLLHDAGVAPPYVLVGHSMAGYDVRVYASHYRDQLAGIVLVDASHPDQENRFPAALKDMQGTWLREGEFLEFTMPFGIPRLIGLCNPDSSVRAVECNANTARETVAEMKAFSESAAQAATTGSFGDLPLVVLSHDPANLSSHLPADLAKPTSDAWEKMQEESAHLSTRGSQSTVKDTSHYIQYDNPAAVIDAVRNVVEQARAASVPPKP
jgi:pimeloyl-ACP methyl ester carboxylesterase